jgi:transposase
MAQTTRKNKQVKSPMVKFSLAQMQTKYPDDKACLEWLFKYQHPNGITCEKCGVVDAKYHYVASRKSFSCQWCGHHVYPCAGTIFDHSSTPMVKWFYAIYLMAQTRTGISAKQLERELGVTYKTAWRMFTLIRTRLNEGGDAFGSNGGDVEVDETYVGGHRKGQQGGRGTETKTAVVGIVERKGKVKATVVPNVTAKTLNTLVQDTVERGANVHTDEFLGYSQLKALGYNHHTIQHALKVYAKGNVHTQSIEGFWAQVKNAVNGVHHGVDRKYLQHYVNEYAFRYSHRNDTTPMFQTILERVGLVI